jgi:aldehyde:ferredoxin oxidoreductase
MKIWAGKNIRIKYVKYKIGIGAIKRAKPYVDINTLQTIYKALVQPYFNYCSPYWETVVNCFKTNYKDFSLAQQGCHCCHLRCKVT